MHAALFYLTTRGHGTVVADQTVPPLLPPWPLYHVSRGDGVSVSHTNDTEDDTRVGDMRPQLTAPTHESSAGKVTGFERKYKTLIC